MSENPHFYLPGPSHIAPTQTIAPAPGHGAEGVSEAEPQLSKLQGDQQEEVPEFGASEAKCGP